MSYFYVKKGGIIHAKVIFYLRNGYYSNWVETQCSSKTKFSSKELHGLNYKSELTV